MSYPYYKKVKIIQDSSARELEQEVNDFLQQLSEMDIDDTQIKLHLATDPNYNTVMVEWIEEPKEEGGDE